MGKKYTNRFHTVISEYEEIFLEYFFCIKLNSTIQLRIPIARNIELWLYCIT